jgi:hypothetical protein
MIPDKELLRNFNDGEEIEIHVVPAGRTDALGIFRTYMDSWTYHVPNKEKK